MIKLFGFASIHSRLISDHVVLTVGRSARDLLRKGSEKGSRKAPTKAPRKDPAKDLEKEQARAKAKAKEKERATNNSCTRHFPSHCNDITPHGQIQSDRAMLRFPWLVKWSKPWLPSRPGLAA